MAVSRSDTTRTKYFGFFAPKTYNTNRIGGYSNTDTTSVSTTSTTRVNLKTYTFTTSSYTNKIRVRIYAYVTGGTGSVYLNINGTDVASTTNITSTSSIVVIDYTGDLTPGTSYTVKVDGSISSSSYSLYIDKVIIYAGYALTSTTPVTIYTNTNVEKYTIYDNSNGGFKYQVGIRYMIQYNRKTTATASFTVNGNAPQNTNNGTALVATDDGDNLASVYGTIDYTTSITLAGNVGASGDLIIVVGFYYQITLRGNQVTPHRVVWAFVSTLKGKHSVSCEWFGWVSVNVVIGIDSANLSTYTFPYFGSKATNGVIQIQEALNIDYLTVYTGSSDDSVSQSGFVWLEVVAYV